MTKTIALLGSTGSIGRQTLQCCRRLNIAVNALGAHQNVAMLEEQAREFKPRYVVVADKSAYPELKTRLADTDIRLLAGEEGMCEAASVDENDMVCNAIMGVAGLPLTLAALEAKKPLALANKESLVVGGHLVTGLARKNNVRLFPVDSEHSAIFQCMQGQDRGAVRKVILTASGGPFLGRTREELQRVTTTETLRHPTWSMGAKITVDCATMMNKGLEFIEAMWLFDLRPDQIEVVVHPQSVVHSAVEFSDGAVIAQLGSPDMAVPIQYALTWPERLPTEAKKLDLVSYGKLTFQIPDMETFSCLGACAEAVRRGGLWPCAINGANEQAVSLFLAGRIPFTGIGDCADRLLQFFDCKAEKHYTIAELWETDFEARQAVLEYCQIGKV